MLGRTLSHYRITAAIGAGGTGERKLALGWWILICHVEVKYLV